MKSSRLFLSSSVVASMVFGAHGQNATTINPTGCVDVSGMQTCLANANSKWLQCVAVADDSEACQWAKDVDQIACYLEKCWNKVYSCEYQFLVASLLSQQTDPPTHNIPFWPAPANAPSGCSCNFGDIYQNATASKALITTKCPQYVNSGAIVLGACQCCAWSAAVSSFYGICPGYDLSKDGLSLLDGYAVNAEPIGDACAAINSSICLGKFGIGSADGGKYIDPAHLPSGGDKVLSTTEGPGPLTTPPGGATMTVTLQNTTYTITAAPYNAANVGSGNSGSSQTPTSTSSSKPNAAAAVRYPLVNMFGLLLPCFLAL